MFLTHLWLSYEHSLVTAPFEIYSLIEELPLERMGHEWGNEGTPKNKNKQKITHYLHFQYYSRFHLTYF